MIARLTISPEVLAETSSVSGRAAKQNHERLLKLVMKHGAVVFPNEDSAAALLNFLRNNEGALPPGIADKWKELLRFFLKGSRMWAERPPLSPPLGTSAQFPALCQAWARAVDLVLVDAAAGSAMGVPEFPGWLVEATSGLSFAYPDAAPECETVRRIDKFEEAGNFAQGVSRELFWNEILLPLWRTSKHATLMDRYLLQGWWQGAAVGQVEWMLERLSGAAGVRGVVTLITEAKEPAEVDVVALLDYLTPICAGGRVDRVRVHLVPRKPDRGARMSHDRHIRFDTSAVSLPAGFDRLSSRSIWDPEGMNWQYRWAKDAVRGLGAAEQRAIRVVGTVTAEREV